ncbi:MAG: sulfate ABC transporter permease subunit CysT [Bauldia sp.]|jgi:sulfate transport system permease protein
MARSLTQSRFRKPSVIPGFGLTFGFAVTYLSLIVLIPIAALILKSASVGWDEFWRIATDARTLAALRTSFGLSLIAAVVNMFFGLILAWVLTRYRFPGRRLIDAMVDLPFALPTAVAGIALGSLYAVNGWIGGFFDFRITYTAIGITIALVFIGLPFVVRTVQPVLEDLDKELEEAAATLGAGRWKTIVRVILPPLLPAVLTGFALAYARAVGEYGSVVFVSQGIPYRNEIAPQLIVIKLEESASYAPAAVIATVMLALAFLLLLCINLLQAWGRRRFGSAG